MAKAEHPKNHTPFMSGVAEFSCARCEYLRPDHHCANEYYQKWHGSSKLPDGDLHKMCSDWFQPREGRKTLGEQVKDQRAGK
jgi:hypothetical protein